MTPDELELPEPVLHRSMAAQILSQSLVDSLERDSPMSGGLPTHEWPPSQEQDDSQGLHLGQVLISRHSSSKLKRSLSPRLQAAQAVALPPANPAFVAGNESLSARVVNRVPLPSELGTRSPVASGRGSRAFRPRARQFSTVSRQSQQKQLKNTQNGPSTRAGDALLRLVRSLPAAEVGAAAAAMLAASAAVRRDSSHTRLRTRGRQSAVEVGITVGRAVEAGVQLARGRLEGELSGHPGSALRSPQSAAPASDEGSDAGSRRSYDEEEAAEGSRHVLGASLHRSMAALAVRAAGGGQSGQGHLPDRAAVLSVRGAAVARAEEALWEASRAVASLWRSPPATPAPSLESSQGGLAASFPAAGGAAGRRDRAAAIAEETARLAARLMAEMEQPAARDRPEAAVAVPGVRKRGLSGRAVSADVSPQSSDALPAPAGSDVLPATEELCARLHALASRMDA